MMMVSTPWAGWMPTKRSWPLPIQLPASLSTRALAAASPPRWPCEQESSVTQACQHIAPSLTHLRPSHTCDPSTPLCDTGVPTHRILLLTFSNRSCSDLTAKLALVAPAVSCRTHHAHALALLRASAHPQASAAVVEPRDQRAIIKEALARHSPPQEKPASKIVRKLLASFAKAKSTGLPQDLPHSVTDRRCFEDYQELLRQRNQVRASVTRVRTPTCACGLACAHSLNSPYTCTCTSMRL